MPRQSRPEEVVMAGDGGRVPDVSEQRAEVEAGIEAVLKQRLMARGEAKFTSDEAGMWAEDLAAAVYDHATDRLAKLARWLERDRREPDKVLAYSQELQRLSRVSAPPLARDPASVLAALLAESPEATVTAIEALLTNDEQLTAAHDHWQERVGWRANRYELRTVLKASVIAACRSLLSKAPKEDG